MPGPHPADVALVHWPAEQHRREQLRRAGAPRLLLVAAGEPAPVAADALEDWLRLPASPDDLRARVEGIEARLGAVAPTVDEHGVVHFRGATVALAPVEARIARPLVRRVSTVVPRELLAAAGWPGADPGRNALDAHMVRLRRRLATIGLAVRTVRSRGYLLEPAPPAPLDAAPLDAAPLDDGRSGSGQEPVGGR